MLIFRSERPVETVAGARKVPSVLLLEPQPLYRAALKSLLESPQIKVAVQSTPSIEQCSAILADAQFDLVVAAITPELTPRRVLAAVTEVRPGVPVLCLAESRDLQGRIDALRAGATGAITRDATPEDFVAAIQAALRGRRSMDEALANRLLATAVGLERSLAQAALSTTEREILGLLSVAWSTRAIADARGISPKSVRNHVTNIYRKLGVSSRPEAMRYAVRMGIGPAPDEGTLP